MTQNSEMISIPKALADQIKKEHALMFGALAAIKLKTGLHVVVNGDDTCAVQGSYKIAADTIDQVTK